MTPIVAPAAVRADQAAAWARQRGATELFASLASLYWAIAQTRGGVRPEVAYCQAAKETGWGRFGRAVTPEHRNPCGLKVHDTAGRADNDPDAHARFATWEYGVAAHCDHLALYAGAAGYPRADTHDPRHFGSLAGRAPTVEELGGAWAPAADYGHSIVRDYLRSLEAAAMPYRPRSDWGPFHSRGGYALDEHNDELIVHHFWRPDVPAEATVEREREVMRQVDDFHHSKGWGGIGYAFVIFDSGRAYEARGVHRTGAHTRGRNRSVGIAFAIDGDAANATPAAWQTLRELDERLQGMGVITAGRKVSGHRDYAAKSCPGNQVYPHLSQINETQESDDMEAAFVLALYEGYFGVRPGDANFDRQGFDFWLKSLLHGVSREQVRAEFAKAAGLS